MHPVILIVGSRDDPHTSAVRAAIERRGGASVVLDRYSADTLTYEVDGGASRLVLRCAEGEVYGEAIGAVWWRLKPMQLWSPAHSEAETAAEFAAREWRAVLFSLPALLPHARWMNPFPAHWVAGHKPIQLQLAKAAGFAVPATTFSNDPAAVRAQVGRVPRCVYKQFSNFIFPSGDFIFTNEVTPQSVAGEDASIRSAPGIYQELVEKRAEWRVTVVRDAIFPIRIDSQKSALTSVDWRRDQLEDMYAVADLPDAVGSMVRDFMQAMGLTYGALDFIERPDGTLVFLECNPAGQWLWLEDATDAPIAASIADYLVGPA